MQFVSPGSDTLISGEGLYRKNRRGAAAVEFALVAPLFFLLVFGMIEFGRMVMVQQVLTNAAREGARTAVLDGSSLADVQGTVNTYCSGAGLSTVAIATNPVNPATAAFGDPVTVTLSVPFSQVSWLPTPIYLGARVMTATCVMRRETSNN